MKIKNSNIFRILLFLILFNQCSATETLEDFENVWCRTNIRDVIRLQNNIEGVAEIAKDETLMEFQKKSKQRELMLTLGDAEEIDELIELLENFQDTASLTLSNFDTDNFGEEQAKKVLNALVDNENIPDEIINFCKTWYKVNEN
tara:strand:- start:139 stop:573 length:435 start_codon:yes stop_codon:yes gene_type:complete